MILKYLLELIYPSRAGCVGCGSGVGQDEPWLCGECRQRMQELRVTSDMQPEHGLVTASSHAYFYRAPADGAVRALKYRSLTALSREMAADMALCLSPVCRDSDVMIPVPMHPRRQRRRGFNHAELLARELSGTVGIPVENALARVRNDRQQARLSRQERLRNLEGAFAVRGDVRGRRALLVDDVYTTGATAENCARALLEAGADRVCVVTYAISSANAKKDGEARERGSGAGRGDDPSGQ